MPLPFLAPLIGALGSAGTAAIGAAGISAAGGILGNYMSGRQASKNRDFQEQMSNTSYQRAMADMKAAGLNPMLAYQKGGASTPSGAMANMTNPFKDVPAAVASAIQLKQLDSQLANIDSQTNLNKERQRSEQINQVNTNANTALSLERIRTEQSSQAVKNTQAELQAEQLLKVIADTNISLSQLSVTNREAIKARIQQEVYSSGIGKTMVWLETLGFGKPSEWIKALGIKPGKKP